MKTFLILTAAVVATVTIVTTVYPDLVPAEKKKQPKPVSLSTHASNQTVNLFTERELDLQDLNASEANFHIARQR